MWHVKHSGREHMKVRYHNRSMSDVSEFDVGFICGLVTGEGSFAGDLKQPVLAIKLHEDDPKPLFFMQERLGGKIYGPYCHGDRRYYFWRLMGKSLHSALPLFARWLTPGRKRDQFVMWIQKYGLEGILKTMSEL